MNRSEAQCFRILGLSGHEDIEEVRSAYRRIAFRLHPDRRGGDESQFVEITAAYNKLVEYLSARQRVGHSSDRGTTRPRRDGQAPRRPASRGHSPSWRSWVPGADESAKDEGHDRPDWSSFERVYRARQARKEAKRRQQKAASGEEKAGTEAPRQQTSTQEPSTPRAESGTPTKRPERKRAETKVDADLASAWTAWCDGARRFHSNTDWREGRPQTDPVQDPDLIEQRDPSAMEDTRPSLWRRLFQRTSNKPDSMRRVVVNGEDMHLRLPVRADTLLYGGQTRIAVQRHVACPICDGRGHADCACAGSCRVKVREEITVDVPPGARSGDQIIVPGKGMEGLKGAPDGDLQLSLLPMALPGFRRQGNDLHGVCTISPATARIGGHAVVDLPRGRVKVNVPPRTCVGDRFRLRGQGLPAWQSEETGDAYLTVEVK
jgi:curved DNA-binding protein CbpA